MEEHNTLRFEVATCSQFKNYKSFSQYVFYLVSLLYIVPQRMPRHLTIPFVMNSMISNILGEEPKLECSYSSNYINFL